jgi:hypothetical protein
MSPTGTCMLCRTVNVDLIDSHIVSRWIYRRILEYAPAAGPQGIAVADGRAGYSGKQLSTYLLCRTCEDLLGDWESYAASISLQDDSMTFPILSSAAILMARSDAAVGQLAGNVNLHKLTRFAVSVFWRADVAQSDPVVDLNSSREPIRRYLLGGPLPSEIDLVLTVLRPRPGFPRIDRVVIYPATNSEDGDRHEFVACGMYFTLFTKPTPDVLDASLPRKGRLVASDGSQLLATVTTRTQTSAPYGKLAARNGKP